MSHDAYDQMLNQDALYRSDLAWQAEIGEHEFLECLSGYAFDLELYEHLREILALAKIKGRLEAK